MLRLCLLFLSREVLWSTRARAAHEEQSPIGQGDVTPICSQSSIFCAVAVHLDYCAGGQGFLGEARSDQRTRRTGLDGPILNASVRLLDVDVDPRMGIDPRHLRHRSC